MKQFKQSSYFFSFILLLTLFLLPITTTTVKAESALTHDAKIDGVYYCLLEKTDRHDAYAIIEDYSNPTNVVDGVYTLPSEVTYEGKTYPVMGINPFYVDPRFPTTIKEIVVPKEFGRKDVKVDFYPFENVVGANNYFTLPVDVEKVTIYASDINIGSFYSDGDGHVENNGVSYLHKPTIKELNFYGEHIKLNKDTIYNLQSLETISFGKDTNVVLDKYAIGSCDNLSNITLPATTKFTEGAIYSCKNLNNITFMDGAPYELTENGSVVSRSNTLLFVPANTKTYNIPSNIKKIGDLAFSNCKKITSVTFNGKTIGEYAFYGCKALTTVTLKETTQKIESYAFALTNLKSITIPKSVKSIGHGCFYKTENLSSIKVSGTHYKCKNGILTTSSGKTVLAVIPQNGAVNIPAGTTTIRSLPVTAPNKVTSLTLPASLKTLYQMGDKMPKLTTITFLSKTVPTVKEANVLVKNLDIRNHTGYNQATIYPSAGGKTVFYIPKGTKTKYKKFIKSEVECGLKFTIKEV